MKKRLLSMLLAAALAVSAVPAMALAVTADEGASNENLLADVSYTGTAEVKTDVDTLNADDVIDIGDYYLSVYNRGRGNSSAGLRIDMQTIIKNWTAGQTLHVSFDARVPFASDFESAVRPRLYYTTGGGSGNQYMSAGADDLGAVYNFRIGLEGWKHYELTTTITTGSGAVTEMYLWLRDGHYATDRYLDDPETDDNESTKQINDPWHHPFDVDNVKIWVTETVKNAETGEDEEKVVVEPTVYKFEDENGNSAAYTNIRAYSGATDGVKATDTDEFVRIKGADGENIVATYDIGSVDTNKYSLNGAVRFAYHDAVLPGETPVEATNVTVQLERNGEVEDLATLADVGNEWVEFDSNLIISSDDADAKLIISADTSLAIDLKAELAAAEFEGTNADLIAVEGGLLAEDDVVINYGDAKLITGMADAESSYLRVYDRTANSGSTGFKAYFTDEIAGISEETGALRFEFDARVPVMFNNDARMRARLTPNPASGVQILLNPVGETMVPTTNSIYDQISFASSWQHYVLELSVDEWNGVLENYPTYVADNEKICFHFRDGDAGTLGSTQYTHPIDIDNFKVYYANDAENVREFTFNDDTYPTDVFEAVYSQLAVEAPESFNRVQGWADNTTVVYENITLTPGVYTFAADIRNAYYETTIVEANKVKVDNTANITVTAGDLGEFYNGAVTTNWTTIEKSVTVYKTTTVDLAIAADGNTPLDYKNVSLVQTADLESLYVKAPIDADEGNPFNGVNASVLGNRSDVSYTADQFGEYIYFPERLSEPTTYVGTIVTPVTTVAGATYTISYDIRTATNGKTYTDPFYLRTELGQGVSVATKTNNEGKTVTTLVTTGDATTIGEEFTTVTHTFVAAEADQNIAFRIRRGYSFQPQPLVVDNLKITAVGADGTALEGYTNDFANGVDAETLNNATKVSVTSYSSKWVVVLEDGLKVEYEYLLTETGEKAINVEPVAASSYVTLVTDAIENLTVSKYKLSTAIAASGYTKATGVKLTVNLSNGESVSKTIDKLDAYAYTNVNLIFTVDEGVSIESFEVIATNSGCGLNMIVPELVAIDAVYGDADGDLEVDLVDATLLAKYIAKWSGFENNSIDTTALDVYKDNKINSLDLIVFVRYLGGWGEWDDMYATLPYDPAN